jgi:two-component system KDP operon response regulator KdpE
VPPLASRYLISQLRRVSGPTPYAVADLLPVIVFGTITVDLPAKQVIRTTDGAIEPIRLTPTEWQILEVLLRNPGKLVSKQVLSTAVWGPHGTSDTGYLRLYVAQLRKKLEPDPSAPHYLLTEAGMGYRFNPGPEAA